MDGSQKLPQRLLETVTYLLNHQKSFHGLGLAIAAWLKYVSGKDLNGKTIDVIDPMADNFVTIAKNSNTSEHYVNSILNINEVFPKNLRNSSVFREEIQSSYKLLERYGSLGSIKKLMSIVDE